MTDMHREDFEKSVKSYFYSTEREPTEPSIYCSFRTNAAWVGWQAAMRYRDEQDDPK